MANKHGGPGPLVPTISVTPHSPGAKHYPVLGEYSFCIPSHMSCKPSVNKTVPHTSPCNIVERNGLHYVVLNMYVVWYSERTLKSQMTRQGSTYTVESSTKSSEPQVQ